MPRTTQNCFLLSAQIYLNYNMPLPAALPGCEPTHFCIRQRWHRFGPNLAGSGDGKLVLQLQLSQAQWARERVL
jgi:hypothetical protein